MSGDAERWSAIATMNVRREHQTLVNVLAFAVIAIIILATVHVVGWFKPDREAERRITYAQTQATKAADQAAYMRNTLDDAVDTYNAATARFGGIQSDLMTENRKLRDRLLLLEKRVRELETRPALVPAVSVSR